VRTWSADLPDWAEIRSAPSIADAGLAHLDAGETSAILIAQIESDVLLLIDDAAGRKMAAQRGITTTGTTGILQAAGAAGLIDLPAVIESLGATNFRISRRLLDDIIADAKRRPGH
jgi:predicted nucleic acid-binding protein